LLHGSHVFIFHVLSERLLGKRVDVKRFKSDVSDVVLASFRLINHGALDALSFNEISGSSILSLELSSLSSLHDHGFLLDESGLIIGIAAGITLDNFGFLRFFLIFFGFFILLLLFGRRFGHRVASGACNGSRLGVKALSSGSLALI